jgi:osmotically-inducible protein OsmY
MQRDRFATGQSGYSSGRSGQDPSLDYQNRNSGYSRGNRDDRQAFGTDDRFTGRGGSQDYARASEAERIGQRDSYGDRNYDQSFPHRDIRDDQNAGRGLYDHRGDDRSFRSRDYGPSESERGAWSTNTQRGEHQGRYDMRRMGPGEHRGKGPRGYTRSDERIKEMVCEALTEDSHIDASGIDVEVRSGEVILSGMVPDRQTKRMAEDLVESLSGVNDVANQLKVSDDERQKLGRAHPSGNQNGNGAVGHEEPRKGDDKKARA